MKFLFSLSLLGISCAIWSQSAHYEISNFSGTYVLERLQNPDDNLRVEDIIHEETFGSGIPTDWTNVNYNEMDVVTSAVWEYRGANTTPNNTIGTVGNCEESGNSSGVPIASETASDGFLIFDSNTWDSTGGSCGDFGTGDSPAPHNAQLTTSSFDFSEKPFVGLIFNQYLKNFNSSFKVQASISGGAFEDVYVSDLDGTNDSSSRDMQVRKNISNVAGGQADVKIRFLFEGVYYFWMIDDFKLVALEANNLEINSAKHDDFSASSSSSVESFENLEYFQYPSILAPELNPLILVENKGGLTQTNCAVEFSVYDAGLLVEAASSAALTLDPEAEEELSTSAITLPADLANYDIIYQLNQDETDDSPENNMVIKNISITENTLARDEGITEGFYVPSSSLNGQQYEIGNVYEVGESGMELYSISGALSSSTNTSARVYAAIYGINVENGLILEPIAVTDEQVIFPYQLNEIGEEQMKVFEFDDPITLQQDSAYLAVIGTYDGAESVTFAVNGSSFPYTSWAKFADNTTFFLDKIPMVRMNFGVVTSVQENELSISGKVYPNPATDQVTVEFSFEKDADLALGLYDVKGRLIENLFIGNKSAGNHQILVDVSNLPAGSYVIKLLSEYGKLEETLIVE